MIPLVYWAAHDRRTDWRWALPLLIPLGWVLTLDLAQAQPSGFRRVLPRSPRATASATCSTPASPRPTRELLAD